MTFNIAYHVVTTDYIKSVEDIAYQINHVQKRK